MKKLIELPKKSWPIVIILTISILSSWQWLSKSLLTNGDWMFHFGEGLKSFASLNFSWTSVSNLGSLNIVASSWPSMFMFGFFGLLHLNSNIADRFVFMFPAILLSGLPSYLLLKKVLNSNIAALVGSFVFSFNTYILIIKTSQLTVLVAELLAPLLILLFIYILEKKKAIYVVLTSMVALLVGSYEFRIFYIVGAILFLYFIFHLLIIEKKQFRDNLKSLIIGFSIFLIVGLLNLYWVLGLSHSSSVLHNAIFDRGLFGSQYLDLPQALTLFHPFWNGTEPIGFLVNPIPFYFWIIPILATLGLFLNRKNPKILFFAFVTLLGFLLTKQEDAPFQNLYLWLYQHFPGFNAFREASKFYLLIALGYSVLIGSFIKWIWEKGPQKKRIWQVGKYALAISISALFLWNIKPFVTGEVGKIFTPRAIPSDYITTKSFLLSQPGYFRTYWLPTPSRWSIYTSDHPKVSGVDIYQNSWKDLLPDGNDLLPSSQRITNILKQPYASELLNQASIKYLIVPLRDQTNDDDFFVYYGDDRQFYIDTLDSLPFLKRVNIGTKDLIVYENTTFKQYISSPQNIYQIPTASNLTNIFNFSQSQLKEEDFNFITVDQNKKVPTTSIADLFADVGLRSFGGGKISQQLNIDNNQIANLFYNTNKPDLSYQINSSCTPKPKVKGKAQPCQPATSLNLISTNKNFLSLGLQPLIANNTATNTVLSKTLTSGKIYILGIGQTPVLVTDAQLNKDLGTINQPVTLYSQDGANLISNPSLEDGLWRKKTAVQDCNNYDDRAIVSMSLDDQDSTNGLNSLQLDADQHIACTGPALLPVRGGDPYMLSFDFKVKNTKDVEYELDFDDPKKTVLKEQINDPDESWRTFQKIINPPAGATHMSLFAYGIPDERRQNHAITHYDNFKFTHLLVESPVNINLNPSFQALPLNGANQTFSYNDSTYNYQNLIVNPSLENGLWQKEVGDCNNLSDSKPILAMKLNSEDTSDGRNSLQLEAQNHTACTGPDAIPVKENLTYRFSFDYQSPNANSASYYISFDDPSHANISGSLPIKDSAWHNFTKYLRVPPNASHLNLIVYSNGGGQNTPTIINRYDNFSLIEVPDIQGRYFLVTPPSTQTSPPANITFDSSSSTLKHVHVAGATKPFYVAMSEAYHDQWRLELNNSQVNGRLRGWIPWVHPNAIADSQHFKLNDFENGWYVDPASLCQDNPQGCTKNADGSYNLEMQIEFVPQRWFYLGTLISAITLLSCLSYLLFYAVRKLIKRKSSVPSSPENAALDQPVSHSQDNLSYFTSLHNSKN